MCDTKTYSKLKSWWLCSPALKYMTHHWKFLAKVTCARNFREKTCACYLQKFYTTQLQVEQQKLQDKTGISWAILRVVNVDSDWPITAHRLRRKLSGTCSISESWLSQVKTCASVYATSASFVSKVAFESDLRKKTFRCVIGFTARNSHDRAGDTLW